MSVYSGWDDLSLVVRGVRVAHRMRSGVVPLLMVHGIGPGTNGMTNFGLLIDRLSDRYAPHLIDLAGFGDSECLPEPPFFDVGFWMEQIEASIEQVRTLHGRLPLLVGNSVGGALALRTAARRHDLPGVIAIGAPAEVVVTPELASFWSVPTDAGALAAAMRPMTGPAREPDPAVVERRLAIFADQEYRTYFENMLSDPEKCLNEVVPDGSAVERITIPATIVHGRLDRACPVTGTLSLMPRLPDADFCLFGGCGHNVISERPSEVRAILDILADKVTTS